MNVDACMIFVHWVRVKAAYYEDPDLGFHSPLSLTSRLGQAALFLLFGPGKKGLGFGKRGSGVCGKTRYARDR